MRPAFGVDIAILQAHQVLLIQRADMPVWGLPGGAVDAYESIAQAAVREAYEETGLIVKLDRIVGIYSRPNWGEGSHAVLFTAHAIGGELLTTTHETINAGFFDRDKLPKDTMSWFHQRIQDVFADQPVVVRSQATTLSHGITSRAEFYGHLRQGDLDMAEVVSHMCRIPEANEEILELS